MCIGSFFLYNETVSSEHPHSLCLKTINCSCWLSSQGRR